MTNEVLQPQDIAALVQTLVYDGRVQLDPLSQDEESFRPARVSPADKSAFSAVPCGVCPVLPACAVITVSARPARYCAFCICGWTILYQAQAVRNAGLMVWLLRR